MNVDIAPPADMIVDLEGPWPWPDSSVADVRAHDVAEHIGDCNHVTTVCSLCSKAYWIETSLRISEGMRHPLGRIHFMNELHRVLAPGGLATIEVPDALRGAGFIQDPTHKTPWCRNSLQYFGAGPGGDFAHGRLAAAYGITAKFRLLSTDYREYADVVEPVNKITWVLEAVK